MRFRHRLEKHKLAERILSLVNDILIQRGLMLKAGTVVDATLITAPSSTKNKDHKRDPDMHSSKKGEQMYFGMKAHIGVDADSGLVHTVLSTSGNVHDVTEGITICCMVKNALRSVMRATEGLESDRMPKPMLPGMRPYAQANAVR